jgi:hypothetical protein
MTGGRGAADVAAGNCGPSADVVQLGDGEEAVEFASVLANFPVDFFVLKLLK